MIRNIILKGLIGREMEHYLTSQAPKEVPLKDRQAFLQDVVEDLEEMDRIRIAGLGITLEQLNAWQEKKKNYF